MSNFNIKNVFLACLFILFISCENDSTGKFNDGITEEIYSITISEDQIIIYNTIPQRICVSIDSNYHSRPPVGIYQESSDKKNWTDIEYEDWNREEVKRGLQPEALTRTTYYRLYADGIYSNILTITVINN